MTGETNELTKFKKSQIEKYQESHNQELKGIYFNIQINLFIYKKCHIYISNFAKIDVKTKKYRIVKCLH